MKKISRETVWTKALYKFKSDKWGILASIVVAVYFIVAILVWANILGTGWSELLGASREGPSAAHWFGTNINGQDVFQRAIYSTKVAFEVGFVVAVISTLLGSLLGCLAGFFVGTILDEFISWAYSCLDSIPFYLFVAAIAFALEKNPYAMHIAMVFTFWTTIARVVRGEVIKLRSMEYVQAARSVGVPTYKIIFKHIFPNTFHIQLVQFTITFVAAIKSEVILSFLGLGIKEGVSWGRMIAEASTEVLSGYYNNFLAASILLFVLVFAFNIFADSLQDALDPKKV